MERFNGIAKGHFNLISRPGPWQFLTKLHAIVLDSFHGYLGERRVGFPVPTDLSKLTEVLETKTRYLNTGRITACQFLYVRGKSLLENLKFIHR